MDLKLDPLCNYIDHDVEISEIGTNKCDICLINYSDYKCKNCEYHRCEHCHNDIVKENEIIINNMKQILISEFEKVKAEVGDEYEIIFYKNTGNIYLHDPVNKTTKRYKHEKQSRFYKCINNIF